MSSSVTRKISKTVVTRRQMLKVLGATGATAALVACGATPTPAPTTAPAATNTSAPAATDTSAPAATATTAATDTPAAPAATDTPAATATAAAAANSGGKVLPADAAPPDQQVYLLSGAAGPGTDGQITGSVYNRSGLADVYAVPLTRINHDFEMVPGAASTWSVSADGLTWTFKLRNDLPWSDGSGNLNADDFIATMQHMADPAVAYDFTWYWDKGTGNIKNFGEVVAKKATMDQLGVNKTDDYTLIMETSVPTPYMPRLTIYYMPFNAKALAAATAAAPNKDPKIGAQYITDPAKCVSCGQFLVKNWSPTRFEAVINTKAAPDIMPFLERVIFVPYQNAFQAYQAGQIDNVGIGSAADIETVLNSPTLSKDATPDVGDFRTDYFFFDVLQKPYDNLKFRQALAHLLDRENIVKNIVKPILGRPAYGFLAPGFPASNEEALKDIQAYNPDMAKQLYQQSGLKVTNLTIIYRNDNPPYNAICSTYADAIKTNLGINVDVKAMDGKTFTADTLATPSIPFGCVSYGMDYLDPSNMLGVFKGNKLGGRHTWNDKQYQDLLAKAGPMSQEPERTQLYQQAEKILTESCAFVWIYHRTPVNLWKPYLKGPGFLPGKVNTNPGWAWPANAGFTPYFSSMYITSEVAAAKRTIP